MAETRGHIKIGKKSEVRNMSREPSYLRLSMEELHHRADKAKGRLASCDLCPWNCHVNRLLGEPGHCRAPARAMISSYNAHFGEEPELVGFYGSGTIFFTHCNLDCIFCQNWEISHQGEGKEVSTENLVDLMLDLQKKKCHNINLVTPTPHVSAFLEALPIAVEKGLKIPFVYNSSGYESLETLKLLENIIDIYMPDFKYWDAQTARHCSGVHDYPQQARRALKEIQRQVGDLKTDNNGLAYRGLLVRHLVLPKKMAGTEKIVNFLAEEISPHCRINIMGQYYPAYQACRHPPLDRSLTVGEYREAKQAAVRAGLQLTR